MGQYEVSAVENLLRLVGIKTVLKTSEPDATDTGYNIPTLWINTATQESYLLIQNDPTAVWVHIGQETFGKAFIDFYDADTAPPGSPTSGDAYILNGNTPVDSGWTALGATNYDWVQYDGSTWAVVTPQLGQIAYNETETDFYIYGGAPDYWELLTSSISGLTYVTDSRRPNTSDNSYVVPTLWVDTTGNTAYVLTDVTTGIATWLKLSDNQLGDAQNSVLSIAVSTDPPPTESTGDRYILDTSGAPNAAWDGAAQEDIVEFDGATWVATTPDEGMFCEVEDEDTVYIFVTSWVKMFQYTGASFSGDSGSAVPTSGGVLTIAGNATQGSVTSATGNTLTVTNSDATTSQKGVSELATDAEVTAGSDTARTVVPSSLNQKLGAQTQYGVITGGGSTGNMEATSAMTNGQVIIGSTGATPVAGNITSSFLTITEGAGTLDIDIEANAIVTAINSWNGAIIETPNFVVSSNGTVITGSVEQDGGGDLTVVFSDGFYTWDTTPADTVTLTAGTDTAPQLNYVYLLQSNKTLTASTSGWPAGEHAPIGTVLCQSAASLQTEGAYKVHAWTDHIVGTNEMGHISHLNYWIREQQATWVSGVSQTFTITTNGGSPDNVILTTTSGVVLQLHDHAFPAFSGTPDVYVVNDSSTPYTVVTDLNALLTDSTGASMSGRYFSLVIWGCVSEDTGDCKLFCNLPAGSYNSAASLSGDESSYANFTIPDAFRGTGFLIAQWNLRHQSASGGTWTSIDEVDLRGLKPSLAPGGTNAFPTEFDDSVFAVYDNGDPTKKIALEASAITTATTRTISMPDKDVSLATATTTNEGIVSELATNAEAQAKSDTSRVLTPSNLAALTASTTFEGLVELATDAEAVAVTATNRAVTPANLAAVFASPPALGSTAAAAVTGTTITANTKIATDGDNDCDIGDGTNAFKDIYIQGDMYFDADNSYTQDNYCWVPISSSTASSSAAIDFVLSGYDQFMVVFEGVYPATDGQGILFRTSQNGGSSFDAGSNNYVYIQIVNTTTFGSSTVNNSTSSTAIRMSSSVGNTALESMSGFVHIIDPLSATLPTKTYSQLFFDEAGTTNKLRQEMSAGRRANSAHATDAIRFLMASGNISAGTFHLYGRTFIA